MRRTVLNICRVVGAYSALRCGKTIGYVCVVDCLRRDVTYILAINACLRETTLFEKIEKEILKDLMENEKKQEIFKNTKLKASLVHISLEMRETPVGSIHGY